jgi:hypothetical protein
MGSVGLVGVLGDADDIDDTGERDGAADDEAEPEGERSRVEGDGGPPDRASRPTFMTGNLTRNSSRESSIMVTVALEVYFDAIHSPYSVSFLSTTLSHRGELSFGSIAAMCRSSGSTTEPYSTEKFRASSLDMLERTLATRVPIEVRPALCEGRFSSIASSMFLNSGVWEGT